MTVSFVQVERVVTEIGRRFLWHRTPANKLELMLNTCWIKFVTVNFLHIERMVTEMVHFRACPSESVMANSSYGMSALLARLRSCIIVPMMASDFLWHDHHSER